MTLVGFAPDKSRVYVRTNEPVHYTVSQVDDRTVVLELENTAISRSNDRRPLDTRFFGGPVVQIIAAARRRQDGARRRHPQGQSGVSSSAGRQRGLVAVRALSRSGRSRPADDRPLVVLFLLAQAGTTLLPKEQEPVRYREPRRPRRTATGTSSHLEGKAELRTDTARIEADQIDLRPADPGRHRQRPLLRGERARRRGGATAWSSISPAAG
mgnify:CR=1 FL=1